MTDRQNAKLNMAERVLDTLKRNESVFIGIGAMVDTVPLLSRKIEIIHRTLKEHKAVNVPASTLEKREVERQLIDVCIKVSNMLYLIGLDKNNKDLITLQALNDSYFYHLTGNAAIAQAKQILDLANTYAADLVYYGMGQAEISAISTAIDAFRKVIAKPMDTITERKQQTTNIAQLFADLDSILYDKLDKLMVMFKHTGFYNEYRTSRNLIITSVRHKNLTVND